MKFTLSVIGLVFAILFFHYYEEDVPKNVEKEPPMTGWKRSVVLDGPAVAARWQKAVERALSRNRSSLPRELIVGIIMKESMGKPGARNKSGATGLLMVKPIVCKELRIKNCDLLDPHKNLAAGVQYLQLLERKYGFTGDGLILAYGVGPKRAKEIIGTKRNIAKHAYVRKVLYARNVSKMYLAGAS